MYPGDCHGYIWILNTVLAFSQKIKKGKRQSKNIVREVMLTEGKAMWLQRTMNSDPTSINDI